MSQGLCSQLSTGSVPHDTDIFPEHPYKVLGIIFSLHVEI